MNKYKIVDELDKLKEKIPDDDEKSMSLREFNDWIDKMQLREKYSSKKWYIRSNKKYVTFETIRCNVLQLFYEKYSSEYRYHKHKPEIEKIITEAVAMTMFYKELLTKNTKKGERDENN